MQLGATEVTLITRTKLTIWGFTFIPETTVGLAPSGKFFWPQKALHNASPPELPNHFNGFWIW